MPFCCTLEAYSSLKSPEKLTVKYTEQITVNFNANKEVWWLTTRVFSGSILSKSQAIILNKGQEEGGGGGEREWLAMKWKTFGKYRFNIKEWRSELSNKKHVKKIW